MGHFERARRVKCDEEKPKCQRCLRTGRSCDGYPDRAPGLSLAKKDRSSQPASKPSPVSLCRPLQDGQPQTIEDHRLSSFAISILSSDAQFCFGASASIFQSVLPQLNHYIPSINAALISFGKALYLQAQSTPVDEDESSEFKKMYLSAVHALRKDLASQFSGTIPPLLSSLLLVAVDVLMKQESMASMHMQGAYSLLKAHQRSRRLQNPGLEHSVIEDDTELIFRAIVLQVAANPPNFMFLLSSTSAPLAAWAMKDVDDARLSLLRIVYNIYPWLAQAAALKYGPHLTDRSFLFEQGRHISHLSQWRTAFENLILPTVATDVHSPLYAHAILLRMWALYLYIRVAVALSPEETAYDSHASAFQQIICDAQTVMQIRIKQNPQPEINLSHQHISTFSTGPGVIQPLQLVAGKYRQRRWRRKAISLLAHAGREGHLNGAREAAVAMRTMQYEEAYPDKPSQLVVEVTAAIQNLSLGAEDDLALHGVESSTIDTPDRARIHEVSRDGKRYTFGQRKTRVTYRRYEDLAGAVACSRKHYPWEARQHRKSLQSMLHGRVNDEWPRDRCEEQHYEVWDEEIEF